MDAAAAAPPPAGRGPWRPLREWGTADIARASIVISASALVALSKLPGGTTRTAAAAGATLASFVTLLVGLWLSTVGRGRRGIAFVNLCISVLALAVTIAQGGQLDLDLLLRINREL